MGSNSLVLSNAAQLTPYPTTLPSTLSNIKISFQTNRRGFVRGSEALEVSRSRSMLTRQKERWGLAGARAAISQTLFSELDSNFCLAPVPGRLGEGTNDCLGRGGGLPPGSKQGGQLRGGNSHPGVTLNFSRLILTYKMEITPPTTRVRLRELAIAVLATTCSTQYAPHVSRTL